MKKLIFLLVVSTFLALSGCSSSETTSTKKNQEMKEEKVSKEDSLKVYFEPMIKAVEENDINRFLEFQNENNPLFYKEQVRWMEEAINRKKVGWKISVEVGEIKLKSNNLGSLEMKVSLQYQDYKVFDNFVTYSIIQSNEKWKINDLFFKEMSEGPLHVYYLDGMDENQVSQILKEASDVIQLYKEQFGWNPQDVHVKLYDRMEHISATIPTSILNGWNETGESLKILIDTTNSDSSVLQLLAHELSHKMLSDFSNDNVSLFLQEGLAKVLENSIQRESDGKLSINPGYSLETENHYLLNIKEFIPINEINYLDYKDVHELYGYGFLVTKYLVETYGFESFMKYAKNLMEYDYIDLRTEHKLETIAERSTKSLEKVYGPIDQLSKEYKAFYEQK
ncbi:hypothetical protein [Peribacillus acanthi]|uniref:hypothetical protein n=1 Tax=Peribacillus acanthi TaxID=2171554 RepID=UPI000D3E9EEA|nr:hypothetical protein [Peribacillus acanthi]